MKRALLVLALCLASVPAHAGALEDKVEAAFISVARWRIDEARQIAERLHASSPNDPAVLALLAEIKFHSSDYKGAVELFEQARSQGASGVLLQNAKLAKAAEEATRGYDEVIGENFIVRFSPGKDSILAPYALETAEAALEKIGGLLGWRPKSRVVIEFYPSASTLAAVSSLTDDDIRNSGTIALCKWNRLMVTSPRGVIFGYEWRDTLSHELTHLLIGGASKNTVPIWLHEGIAKFAETAWRDKPGLGLTVQAQRSLQKAAKEDRLISFERMHPSMAKLETQEETSLAFAEVFTFIEYMVELKGWEAIRTILTELRKGKSEDEAVFAAFGVDLKDLSKRWMLTLKTRKIKRDGTQAAEREVVVKDRADAPDDSLHGLSKSARRFARAADLLYARGRLKAAQEELKKAFAATKSPVLSTRLARVSLAIGDFAAAEKAARDSLEAMPDMAGPNIVLAEALVQQKKLEEAKIPIERAMAVNPFDPRIHQTQLMILAEGDDPEARRRAEHALKILMGISSGRPGPLGIGGLVRVEGPLFSRVFVKQGERLIPTGMTAPTPAFSMGTGSSEIVLVPSDGPAVTRTINVERTPPDGEAQRITADKRGS